MLEMDQLSPDVIDQLAHPELFRRVLAGDATLAIALDAPIDQVEVGGPIAQTPTGEIRVLFTQSILGTDTNGNRELDIRYHGYTTHEEITPKQREEHLNRLCSRQRRLPNIRPAISHGGSVL